MIIIGDFIVPENNFLIDLKVSIGTERQTELYNLCFEVYLKSQNSTNKIAEYKINFNTKTLYDKTKKEILDLLTKQKIKTLILKSILVEIKDSCTTEEEILKIIEKHNQKYLIEYNRIVKGN